MKLVTLILISLMSLATARAAEAFPNPFILQRADPWVLKHDDGYYYFIATTPQYDRIELRRAETLMGLREAEPKTIWRKHEQGPMSHHIWAPELHFVDGKWYIHFAAGEAERIWNIRMFVLENPATNPLEGEWAEKGKIETAWDSFSLDATTFEHNGTQYLVWAQNDPNIGGNTNLYISRMANPWTLEGPQVMLTKPEYDWEVQLYRVNEGPAALKRNGRIYLSYSASGTDHNYAMGLLWADEHSDLLDPQSWSKSPGPVLWSSYRADIYGPGHNGFTTDEEGNDVLVYHARNFRQIEGEPLRDWNRHARLQRFGWTDNGFPDFGFPAPETEAELAPQPLFRDPLFDGAADPVVIWNEERGRWWMFYTNRRANDESLSGVAWVHGTHIGIAESVDQGVTWQRLGDARISLPDGLAVDEPTYWAPEVIAGPDGIYHMYLSYVPGVFEDWNHPRSILHLTSHDLLNWEYRSTLALASDRVIDACVLQLESGLWRMWYNNERDDKSIYYADSPDLYQWSDGGKVVGDRPGEGPKVVKWKGYYWLVTDVWDGLGVYRSSDAENWTLQEGGNLLQKPGSGPDDRAKGQHPDIVTQGDRAFLFYFTHPGRAPSTARADGYEQRRTSIQVTELFEQEGRLAVDRDKPTRLKLDPRL